MQHRTAAHALRRRNAATVDAGQLPPGDYGPAPTCRNDVVVPGCGTASMPNCDVQMVAGVLRDLAGGTSGTLTMAPKRTNYFQPLSEKLEVIDSSNPDVNRRVEIQTIEINRIPQEPFSDALAVDQTAAALSDFFGSGFDHYGKPVAYGIYAQAQFIHVFEYGIWNIETVPTDIYGAHFGNSLDSMPPFLTLGQPFNEQ